MTKRISCVSILLCIVSFAAIALTPAAPKKHRAAVSATYNDPVIRYGAYARWRLLPLRYRGHPQRPGV